MRITFLQILALVFEGMCADDIFCPSLGVSESIEVDIQADLASANKPEARPA
jgi:hypothetical protein